MKRQKVGPILAWTDFIGTTIIYQNPNGRTIYYTSNLNDSHMYRVKLHLVEKDMKRQINIERYLFDIGPCFPHIIDSFSVSKNKLPDFLKYDLRQNPKAVDDVFQISEMAKINFDITTSGDIDTFKRYTFFLFWSYWAANSHFGFRHGNITLKNIAIRQLVRSLKLVFNEKKYITVFQYMHIPVYINYKRSTLLATRYRSKISRNNYDKTVLPPELLLNIGGYMYEEDAHDVWSLAITL